jgi:hypothetical protein
MSLYKQPWVWIVILALLISGVIIISQDNEGSFFKKEKENEVALTVNGSEISKEEFLGYTEGIIEYQMEVYGMSEEEVMDSAVKLATQKIVLSDFIDTKGIQITEEEVQEKYDDYKQYYPTPSGEELPPFDEARADIEYEVKVDKLIEMYLSEAEITDEEVVSFYEVQEQQMEEMGTGEMPSFEESEEDIKDYLLEQKATSLIQEELEKLIEEAEVDVLITIDEIEFPEKEEVDVPELEVDDEEVEVEMDEETETESETESETEEAEEE